jgi:hypothetical protein
MKRRSSECIALIEHAVTQIRDASTYWQGDAYYAAYDRIAGDRDQAKKASEEIGALAQALTDGGSLLTGYRQALLDKVADATTAGFTVADDWTVTATQASDTELLRTHQTAVTTALNEMLGFQTDTLGKIEQANTNVQTRTDQLGPAPASTSPVSLIAGSPQADPNQTTSSATSPTSTATPLSTETKVQDSSKQTLTGSPVSQPQDSSATQTQSPTKSNAPTATKPTTDTSATGTDSKNSPATQTSDKGKPGEWRPGDIADLIKAASSITGSIPALIESNGEFLKDTGELVKSGGEAVAKITDSVTKLVTTVDQVTHHTTGTTDQHSTTSPPDKSSPAPTASPDKNTDASTAAPPDKNTTTPTATPDKTRVADWSAPTTTTTAPPSVAQPANNSLPATSQPLVAPSFPSVATTREKTTERTRHPWTLDLPNPTQDEQPLPAGANGQATLECTATSWRRYPVGTTNVGVSATGAPVGGPGTL